MNYRDENSTPRDRISAELFFREYVTEIQRCGCRRDTREDKPRCANGCRETENRGGCKERTDGCGCMPRAASCAERTRSYCERHTNSVCTRSDTDRRTESRTGCGCMTYRRTGTGCGCSTERHRNTGCNDRVIPAPTLAMSYIPMQQWGELMDCETALREGTLFRELVFPFYPTPCCQRRDRNL